MRGKGPLLAGILLSLNLAISSSSIPKAAAAQPVTEPQITPMNGPEQTRSLKIMTGNDSMDIEAHAVRVRIQLSGKTAEDILFILFEPKTGLTWWDYRFLDSSADDSNLDKLPAFLEQHKVAVADGKIVTFRLDGSRMYIRESSEKQPTFQKALEVVLSKMKKNLKDVHGDPVEGRQTILLAKSLGRDFFRGSKLVAQWRPSKLLDANRVDAKWVVALSGPDGERAIVTLGQNYAVEQARRDGIRNVPGEKGEKRR